MLFLSPKQSSDYTTAQESCLLFPVCFEDSARSICDAYPACVPDFNTAYLKLLEECELLSKSG